MKSFSLTALMGVGLLCLRASATILLNEIHVNPPGEPDHNFEYVEFRSTTDGPEALTGLTLLVIENNGGQVGEVEEAFDLSGYSTGANGLLLIGNGYDDSSPGGPWAGFKFSATASGDPSGVAPYSSLGDSNLAPNGGLTFLLVSGWTGMSNATSDSLGDVDLNNNSIVDWLEAAKPPGAQTVQPFATIVDSIGFRDLANVPARLPYTSADLNVRSGSPATFAPDNISRRLTRIATPGDQNNASAWYGGNMAGTTGPAIEYDVQVFGDFRGQATPGQDNLDAAPVAGNFLINEVSVNPPGEIDGNFEYIELINTSPARRAASLQGLALLVIRSNDSAGKAALGTIREAWDLGPYSTGANGLLMIGNSYPAGDIPWAGYTDPQTQLGDPEAPTTQSPVRWSSMGDSDIGTNDGFTVLLVQNFTGTIDQDLDANDDGTLDITPWTAIKDSVGIDQIAPGLGKTYASAKVVTAPAYEIDNVSRKAGNAAANAASAWYGGRYGGNSPFSIAFQDTATRPAFGGFRGAATPGRVNLNAPAAPSPIRLNEVHIDPVSSSDKTYEYVELINTDLTIGGMNGLTLVIADGRTGVGNGQILEAVDLSRLSTGPNGLILLGDNYDTVSPYDSPVAHISPLTAREDPAGLEGADEIGPNAGVVLLITKGTRPAVGSNISGIPVPDIVDSMGIGSSSNPAVALLNPGFTPHNVSRYPGNFTANSAGSWFGGELDASLGNESLMFGVKFAGAFKGGASPGRYNHAATPGGTARLLLNEIHINPPGSDGRFEFVEYRVSPAASISTNGYTLLMLDGAGSNVGTVVEAWSLDGLATGANGLLLTGAGYPANQPWLGEQAPASATPLASPAGLSPGDLAGSSNNGTVSLLLVKNFTGRVGQDLDMGTGVPLVGADDGVFELTPWSVPVADAVGVRSWDAALQPPALTGRVYGGVDLSQAGYTPDTLSRHGADETISSAAWFGGEISGVGGTSITLDAVRKFPLDSFAATVTPGHPNPGSELEVTMDTDADGTENFVELALRMNPQVADPQNLPRSGTIDVAGKVFPTLAYTRFSGGAGGAQSYTANGFVYETQASSDLISWTASTEQISITPNGDGLTETAVIRPQTSFFNEAAAGGAKVFLRLKIRQL